ncbi:Lsr2 dimerization domain-containing protein [Dietzia cinnamea]|uniref:Lsr2 dimerization domain-containing protein n=1 Tax=Dietzia cinnamea TaxID=321318 RepID=UPI003CFDC53A
MAQQFHVRFIDDLDGTDLGDKANTITFAFEGKDYSIDLSDANADTFREAMKPYINAGHRVAGSKTKTSRRSTTSANETKGAVTAHSARSRFSFSTPVSQREKDRRVQRVPAAIFGLLAVSVADALPTVGLFDKRYLWPHLLVVKYRCYGGLFH